MDGAPRVSGSEIGQICAFIGRPDLPHALGFPREVIDDPESMVPAARWYDLVEAATVASADPFLGLHFGFRKDPGFRTQAGAMRLLVIASDTLRVAIDRLQRYHHFWNQAERYENEDRDGRLSLRYWNWGPSRPAHAQLAEKMVAQSIRFVRSTRGPAALAVRFRHSRRPGSEELTRVLGIEPTFDAESTEVVFPSALLDARLPTPDAVLFRVLDHQLAERLRDTTPASAFTDQVRKAVADYLHREDLSIELVAGALLVSTRTLQRRLADEQSSFRDLVDEVRKSRAFALLREGAPVAELSFMLGWAEEASLYHAFRRWTGSTPEVWRQSSARADRTLGAPPREAGG